LTLNCTSNQQRSESKTLLAQLSMALDHVKVERRAERKKREGEATKTSFNISKSPVGGK